MGLHTHPISYWYPNISYAEMQVFIPFCPIFFRLSVLHPELFIREILHYIYFLFYQIFVYIILILIIGI